MPRFLRKVFCAAFMLYSAVYAQQVLPSGDAAGDALLEQERLRLAVSSLDYPVTLGDLYRLNYRQTGGTVISLDVRIDVSGIVGLGTFGKIDARGLTFQQLKQKVEDQIAKNYPYSLPEFSLVSPGIFRVKVRDSGYQNRYFTVWGLSRLSELVAGYDPATASLRKVELVALSGESFFYDLVSSGLAGNPPADPLLKPGDTIVLHRPVKSVTLLGEVIRPGTYELVGGEGMRDLVENFGGGTTSKADQNRVRIDRFVDGAAVSEYTSLPLAYSAGLSLSDGDAVVIRGKNDLLPTIWFEGAVLDPRAADQGAVPEGAAPAAAEPSASGGPESVFSEGGDGRFSFRIRDGQMLSDILQDARPYFHPLADLGSALLFTADPGAPGRKIDIPALLSGSDFSTDVRIHPGYRIMLPSVRSTVTVSGAVYMPGAVRYKPNAPASYYITSAGGTDAWRNSFRACTVYDQYGNKKKSSAPIMPGDLIHVKENDLGYLLERRVPIIASIVGLVTTIITLSLMPAL